MSYYLWPSPCNPCDPCNAAVCMYSLETKVDWDDNADLDAYTREVGEATVSFLNLTEGNLSLNLDAHPGCDPDPFPPEIISSSVDFTESKSFEAWFDQFSDCEPPKTPSFAKTTIKNTGTSDIFVNGTLVSPGDSFLHDLENAGYNTGGSSTFVPAIRLDVTC